jgi:short-subunit dehydrogenase
VLFNNAGMGVGGPIKETTYDDWDWGLGVMIGGTVNGVQAFLPYLLKHGEGGHILNTSSMSCIIPLPMGSAIYTTAKAAVCAMAEALRGELAADNIGVSAFCPGPVQSNIHESMKTRPEKFKKSAAQIAREKQMGARVVSPLWMTNEECGTRILSGIRNNDLFIFTHPEFKEGTARRFEAMLDSYPDEPINEERKKAISFLLWNKIYDEAIDIRKGPRV